MKYYKKKEWLEKRRMGKGLFIMQYGGLRGMIILMFPVMIIPIAISLIYGTFSFSKLEDTDLLKDLVFLMAFGFMIGSTIAWFFWHYKEQEFRKS